MSDALQVLAALNKCARTGGYFYPHLAARAVTGGIHQGFPTYEYYIKVKSKNKGRCWRHRN